MTDNSLALRFRIELEFGNVGFRGEGKAREAGKKTSRSKDKNNKLNPDITPSPGIEPGPHWWEAGALTAVPSLFPKQTISN